MHIDTGLALGGILVGFLVGLTGVGGGALLTPMLVFFFGVDPKVAVGSDLVVSLFMKPVGAVVHARRNTVRWDIVGRLVLGSVPGALAGVLVLARLSTSAANTTIKQALGMALILAAVVMLTRERLHRYGVAHERDTLQHRSGLVVGVGAFVGVLVGLTSVGSGSLVIVALTLLYPALGRPQLVGTDIVQAIPLVGAAAFGHLILGDVNFGVASSLLLGAWPGIYLGSRVSARYSNRLVRLVMPMALLASAAKMLGLL